MPKNLFNEKKAAQRAAYFLARAGKPLSVLKLTKLMSDREGHMVDLRGRGSCLAGAGRRDAAKGLRNVEP